MKDVAYARYPGKTNRRAVAKAARGGARNWRANPYEASTAPIAETTPKAENADDESPKTLRNG